LRKRAVNEMQIRFSVDKGEIYTICEKKARYKNSISGFMGLIKLESICQANEKFI
jgi:hypothetical protein